MVGGGADASFAQHLGYLAGASSAAYIYDGRAGGVIEHIKKFGIFVLDMSHYKADVWTCKAQGVFGRVRAEVEPCHDVATHLWRGRGCKCQYRHARDEGAQFGNFEI